MLWTSNEWKVWIQNVSTFTVTNSSLITFSHTHTHTGTWQAHHFIQMQMRGEIDANKSKGNEQGRFRKKRGRASLSQHQLLQREEMETSAEADATRMNDSYLSGVVEDNNRIRQLCRWPGGWECDGLTSVLTLVELVLAAWAAEGAERPRFQASPALHPAFCRPGVIPGSMKRSAATSHHIIMAWQQIPLLSISVCINTCALTRRQHTAERCRCPSHNFSPPLAWHQFWILDVYVDITRHIYISSPHAETGEAGGWDGRGWREKTGLSSHLVRPGPTPGPFTSLLNDRGGIK